MTLVRNPQIIQAQCPGCKQSLRIPSSWVGESMKCKHCGLTFQAKPSAPPPPRHVPRPAAVKPGVPLPAARPGIPVGRALPAVPPPLPRAVPAGGYSAALPAAIPVGPVGGALPAAIPVGAVQGALPAAIPVGANYAAPVAVAAPAGAPFARLAGGGPSRRRARGGLQKLVFAAVFLLALGSLGGILYMLGNTPLPEGSSERAAGPGVGGPDAGSKHPSNKEGTPLPDPAPTTAKKPETAQAPKDTAPSTKPATVVKGPATERVRTTEISTRPSGTAPKATGLGLPTSPFNASKEPFPRRMLAVVPANYAFANTVAYGSEKSSLNSILREFAKLLHIPDDQVVVLSDRANSPKPPIKAMIELNVAEFLKSCRPQDRVVLMFVGHGVEKDGKGYFLPLEGDVDDVATLIPLEWFYEQLKACPAQQKVFVVDVCRFDPSRGQERGKVDPMGAKFDEALQAPPAGVQVLTSCGAGQYSYEIESKGNDDFGGVAGGVMLNLIPDLNFKGGLRGVIQKPEDPIPVDTLARILGARTKSFAEFFLKKEQKPRLSGKVPEATLAYDAKTALAPHFELKLTDLFKEGVAHKDDIQRVIKIVNEIPAVKSNGPGLAISFDSLPPYPAKALEDFKDDGNMNPPLRILVRDAVNTLKENATAFTEAFDAPPANPQQENAFKDRIVKIDKDAAAIQFKLSSVREELLDDTIVAARDKESKYWQAAYDYTLARLNARIAYVYEYKVKLGEIRKEFPERDPNIHSGWRLASREKMDALAEKDAKEAQKILGKMAEDYKGTPWELIARREKLSSFGLEWKPRAK